jgi:peptidoglycan/xylan/chitin deacetylase (PgdA/CDA1 family)
MLKKIKQTTLSTLKTSGVFRLVENSRWRQRRLLILAYHGISLEDEHQWDPSLYMSPQRFRRRMQLLKDSNCTVLSLSEAIRLMYAQALPERAVVLTFDDGNYDFINQARPILREFDFPATVYLTTFYSRYPRPVFDVVCSYLLWKGGKQQLDLGGITGQDQKVDLSNASSRRHALDRVRESARENGLSAEEKDSLAAAIAAQLGIDYEAFSAKRILQILAPDEVKALAAEGVDIQLHTHRHRVPADRSLFMREIEDNRNSIEAMTGTKGSHFCYPSGVYETAFLPWLEEAKIVSATTCDIGFASPQSHPLLLPRLLDTGGLSDIEFEGWLTGVAALLPRRREMTS